MNETRTSVNLSSVQLKIEWIKYPLTTPMIAPPATVVIKSSVISEREMAPNVATVIKVE
jgi:hypothetical protein